MPEEEGRWRDDIFRTLGALVSKVDSLHLRLTESEAASAKHRQEIRSELLEVKLKLNGAIKDIADMKPEVELVKGLRLKAAGAIVVLGALGAMCYYAVERLLDRIFGGT